MSNISTQFAKLMSASMLLSNTTSQIRTPFTRYNEVLYAMDEEISYCETKMYLVLMTLDEEKQKEKFQEFKELYDKLSQEKQEYIRYQYLTLCEEKERQEINEIQDNYVKIKKKGEDNYE